MAVERRSASDSVSMTLMALQVAAFLALFSVASGCSVPKGSCKPAFCNYLWEGMGANKGYHNYSWPIGFYQGIWNFPTPCGTTPC